MPPEKEDWRKELVIYRLETSKERLEAAVEMLSSGRFKDANNRAYYSIYHAIGALHALDGHTYKSHKESLGNFNRIYVKDGIFPRELGHKVSKAEEIRRFSDYNDFYIASREQAQEQIETAEELLHMVETYCRSKLEEENGNE